MLLLQRQRLKKDYNFPTYIPQHDDISNEKNKGRSIYFPVT